MGLALMLAAAPMAEAATGRAGPVLRAASAPTLQLSLQALRLAKPGRDAACAVSVPGVEHPRVDDGGAASQVCPGTTRKQAAASCALLPPRSLGSCPLPGATRLDRPPKRPA